MDPFDEFVKKQSKNEDNDANSVSDFEDYLKSLPESKDFDPEDLKEPFLRKDEFLLQPGQEFWIKHNKLINNPTETWGESSAVYILPESFKGLKNGIRFAEEMNFKSKGLGNRHSFSKVVQTKKCYFDLRWAHPYHSAEHEETIDKIDQSSLLQLKDGMNPEKYFDTPSGMKIYEINDVLDSGSNRRIFNMGGGDVQAFAGAMSTGTHGSGGKYAAYHDMVRSLVIVCTKGRAYRVEPSNGITDPAKHALAMQNLPEDERLELIQDDDKFNSLLVSFGSFGIIYSVIMEVTDLCLLNYKSTYIEEGWTDELKSEWNNGLLPDDEELFYYILVNPYKLGNNQKSSITKKIARTEALRPLERKENKRKFWPSVFTKFNLTAFAVKRIANNGDFPKRRIIETALKTSEDSYTDKAYKVWNTGVGKLKNIGTGIEFAFPIDEVADAMDHIMAFLESEGKRGNGFYVNSPIAIRFVKAGNAYLAPNYKFYKGKEVKIWAYIEVTRVNGINEGDDLREIQLFQHLQSILFLKGGRPHWGLNFDFPFNKNILTKIYPKLDEWKKAFHFFNPDGFFDNQFTDDCEFRDQPIA